MITEALEMEGRRVPGWRAGLIPFAKDVDDNFLASRDGCVSLLVEAVWSLGFYLFSMNLGNTHAMLWQQGNIRRYRSAPDTSGTLNAFHSIFPPCTCAWMSLIGRALFLVLLFEWWRLL